MTLVRIWYMRNELTSPADNIATVVNREWPAAEASRRVQVHSGKSIQLPRRSFDVPWAWNSDQFYDGHRLDVSIDPGGVLLSIWQQSASDGDHVRCNSGLAIEWPSQQPPQRIGGVSLVRPWPDDRSCTLVIGSFANSGLLALEDTPPPQQSQPAEIEGSVRLRLTYREDLSRWVGITDVPVAASGPIPRARISGVQNISDRTVSLSLNRGPAQLVSQTPINPGDINTNFANQTMENLYWTGIATTGPEWLDFNIFWLLPNP